MRLPQLVLPLVVKHGTMRATLNPFPKSHVTPFYFPNDNTDENYHVAQNDQPNEERISVKEKIFGNEDCSPQKIHHHHFQDIGLSLAACRVSREYALPLHNDRCVIVSSEVRRDGRMFYV